MSAQDMFGIVAILYCVANLGSMGLVLNYMLLLGGPFGLLIALGSMFLIAVGIYFHFKKNKWLE